MRDFNHFRSYLINLHFLDNLRLNCLVYAILHMLAHFYGKTVSIAFNKFSIGEYCKMSLRFKKLLCLLDLSEKLCKFWDRKLRGKCNDSFPVNIKKKILRRIYSSFKIKLWSNFNYVSNFYSSLTSLSFLKEILIKWQMTPCFYIDYNQLSFANLLLFKV